MEHRQCVGCDRERPQIQAVIDLDSERAIGVICHDCLTSEFGATILIPDWIRGDGCAICERDAFYALPEIKLVRESQGPDQILSRYSYEICEETLCLCDEHLTWIADYEGAPEPVAADGRGYRW